MPAGEAAPVYLSMNVITPPRPEMQGRRVFAPLDLCLGPGPSDAANARPFRKRARSPTAGPIPSLSFGFARGGTICGKALRGSWPRSDSTVSGSWAPLHA